MAETRSEPLPEERPERHEHSDIRARPVFIFFAIAALAGVLAHLAMYFLLGGYRRSEEAIERARPRTAIKELPPVPEPRLQGLPGFHPSLPREDLQRLREEFSALLGSYGASGEPGYARIPIERAMDLLVEKGLEGVGLTDTERRDDGPK
jgi:hypothetical protein